MLDPTVKLGFHPLDTILAQKRIVFYIKIKKYIFQLDLGPAD